MQAEIIAIGDELASGQRLDTNSQWLSQQLGDLGLTVTRHITIGDQLPVNIAVMQEAAARSQVVIVSGGLGPTLDDLTREAMAAAFDLPLELDPDSLNHIEQLFSRRGRPMPERNRVQAMFPKGTLPVTNPHGSAPGIDLTVQRNGNQCRFFALPGVPAEMKQMWSATVKPRLEEQLGTYRDSLFFYAVKLFGLGESDVEARVPTLIARDRYPTVGITVSQATITLRIAARAKTESQFQQLIAPTLEEIHNNLGELIFGYGDDELFDALQRELIAAGQSLAVLEIGAGGWINEAMLASTGHSSEMVSQSAYRGGVSLPNLAAARQWLRSVCPGLVVSEDQLLLQATQTICEQMGASIGLCVSSYPSQAEISQSVAGKTFPIDFVIVSREILDAAVKLEQRQLGGHPEVLNPRVAKIAADLLRKQLMSHTKKSQLSSVQPQKAD